MAHQTMRRLVRTLLVARANIRSSRVMWTLQFTILKLFAQIADAEPGLRPPRPEIRLADVETRLGPRVRKDPERGRGVSMIERIAVLGCWGCRPNGGG